MDYEQIKERMKQKYREKKEAEAREQLSQKRSAARSVQWAQRKKQKKISSKKDWVLHRNTLYAKLPDETIEQFFPSFIIDAIKAEEGKAYVNLRRVCSSHQHKSPT